MHPANICITGEFLFILLDEVNILPIIKVNCIWYAQFILVVVSYNENLVPYCNPKKFRTEKNFVHFVHPLECTKLIRYEIFSQIFFLISQMYSAYYYGEIRENER